MKRFLMNRQALLILCLATSLFFGCRTSKGTADLSGDKDDPAAEEQAKKPLPFNKIATRKADLLDDSPIKASAIDSQANAPQLERKFEMPTRQTSRPETDGTTTEYPDNLIKGITDPDTELSVDLTFDATDISEVVEAFANESLLNFGYLLDPGVKGAVSMSVRSKMTAREAWGTFEHILWLCGAYASKNPGFIHILPFDKMPKERRIFAEHEIQPNVIVEFFPLRYKKSADVINIIKPFLTDGATATDVTDSNTVIIVEAPANIHKIREIIARLDDKGEREWPAKCFPCHEVEADILGEELQNLLPVLGLPVASGTGTSGGAIKLTALPRIGAIVVSAALPEVVDEVGNWIKALDRSDMLDKEEIYFYNVHHSTVEKLSSALDAFFNTTTTESSTSTSSTKSTSSKASASTGSTNSSSRNRNSTTSTSSTSNSSNSSSSSRNRNNRNRDENENSLTKTVFDTEVIVFSDEESNRLTIKTTPRTWNLIKVFLERQDVPPRQVSIQAIITDITLTKGTEFGVSYAASRMFSHGTTTGSGVSAGAGALGGLLGSTPTVTTTTTTTSTTNTTNNTGTGTDTGTDGGGTTTTNVVTDVTTAAVSSAIVTALNGWASGMGLIIQRASDPLALIKAVAGEGNTKILSEPQLVVRSGAEATLQSGKSVAIATESTNYTNSSGNFSSNYEYQDVGVIMTVTPYITAGHDVRMVIQQEVSDTIASENRTDTPDISKKKVTTELIAPDNSTVLMGGMIRNSEISSKSGIPWLKDIPYLGALFSYNNKATERSELLILLTVNVLDNDNPQEELIRRYKASLEEIEKRRDTSMY